MSKPQDFIVLGRKIGTFEGWDDIDTFIHLYYAVKPLPELNVGTGPSDWTIDYETGTVQQSVEGEPDAEFDLVPVLARAPKAE